MTATRARNPIGIFSTKRARGFAQKHNLDLFDKNCYGVSSDKLVTYSDVLFIVDNLWISYIFDSGPEPITTTWDEYNIIYNKLREKWPHVFYS